METATAPWVLSIQREDRGFPHFCHFSYFCLTFFPSFFSVSTALEIFMEQGCGELTASILCVFLRGPGEWTSLLVRFLCCLDASGAKAWINQTFKFSHEAAKWQMCLICDGFVTWPLCDHSWHCFVPLTPSSWDLEPCSKLNLSWHTRCFCGLKY